MDWADAMSLDRRDGWALDSEWLALCLNSAWVGEGRGIGRCQCGGLDMVHPYRFSNVPSIFVACSSDESLKSKWLPENGSKYASSHGVMQN